jgi:hypothetical protein
LDTSEYKQRKTIHGIQIQSPEVLKDAGSDVVVIYPSEPYGRSMNAYLDEIKFKGKRVELTDSGDRI